MSYFRRRVHRDALATQPRILRGDREWLMNESRSLEHGKALMSQGRFADAATAFAQHVALAPPGTPDVHNELGIDLGHLGNWDSAVAAFTEALRLKPDFANAYVNLAVC